MWISKKNFNFPFEKHTFEKVSWHALSPISFYNIPNLWLGSYSTSEYVLFYSSYLTIQDNCAWRFIQIRAGLEYFTTLIHSVFYDVLFIRNWRRCKISGKIVALQPPCIVWFRYLVSSLLGSWRDVKPSLGHTDDGWPWERFSPNT